MEKCEERQKVGNITSYGKESKKESFHVIYESVMVITTLL